MYRPRCSSFHIQNGSRCYVSDDDLVYYYNMWYDEVSDEFDFC